MKRTLFFTLFLLGLSLNLKAQVDAFQEIELSNKIQQNELDFEDLEPLSEELSAIDNLEEIANKDIAPFRPPPRQKRGNRPPEWKPTPFQAVVKPGSIIKDIKSGQKYRVVKKVVVMAEEKFNGSLISYIHDSKSKLKFEVRTHNLVDISRDLDLLSGLPSHEEFAPQSQRHTTNKYFKVQNGIFYSLENISANYFSDLFDTDGSAATAYRWDYRFYFRWKVPVYFGLTAGIQTGTFDTGDGALLKWTSYYFGPAVKWRFRESKNWAWELHSDFQKSMNFNAQSDFVKMSFGSNIWNLEGAGVFKTGWGDFSGTMAFKKQRMTLKSSSSSAIQKSDRKSITYLSFGFGYQWNFDL
ncbi:MAG: hypothetical protein KC493_12335 [Bacteriovoracaceae bacterium]|nr:hypothetical protein [Bacteriovoracaceae bacterium]